VGGWLGGWGVYLRNAAAATAARVCARVPEKDDRGRLFAVVRQPGVKTPRPRPRVGTQVGLGIHGTVRARAFRNAAYCPVVQGASGRNGSVVPSGILRDAVFPLDTTRDRGFISQSDREKPRCKRK